MNPKISTNQWLLVEDEPDLFDLLIEVWEAVNMKAIAYTTGEDTLSWLETIPLTNADASHQLPKFALIDIRLPGSISGIDVATELSHHPVLSGMPIALMTAYRISPQEEKTILEKSRANCILYKPLPHVNELREILLNLEFPR